MIRPILTEVGIFLIPFAAYAVFLIATRAGVLCFINQNGAWPAIAQRLLHRVMILFAMRLYARHEMDVHITTFHFALVIDERFVHFVQHSSEVIAPVEVAGWRRYRLDAHYRQPRRIGLQSRERLRREELLDPRAQRRLSHPGRSEDQNN